jgi:peroxiredoxin family protein
MQGLSTFHQIHGAMQHMYQEQLIQASIKGEVKLLQCPMYRAVYDTYQNKHAEKGKRTEGKQDPQVSHHHSMPTYMKSVRAVR